MILSRNIRLDSMDRLWVRMRSPHNHRVIERVIVSNLLTRFILWSTDPMGNNMR
jgi:hypothetical protein